jgi:DNA-directed RNA polymerase subunit RPC12/RpoP
MTELSDHVLKKWTPKQLISEMLELDPTADQSASISIGIEKVEGISPNPEDMEFLGTDFRFSMRWANKNYNVLGNFLHVPTMYQIEIGNTPTGTSIINKATEIADACDKILKSPIYSVSFGSFFEFSCQDCNSNIRRRLGSFILEQGITCPKCRAIYDVEQKDPENLGFRLRKSKYSCLHCGAENGVGTHKVAEGAVLECSKCSRVMTVEQRFTIILKE